MNISIEFQITKMLFFFPHFDCDSCTKPNQIPVHMEQLTPIDEEPSDGDEEPEEDQPITMIPKIMHTAPSPTSDNPPTSNVNPDETPKYAGNSIDRTIPEVQIEDEHDRKQSNQKENSTKNGDKEFRQIESVL